MNLNDKTLEEAYPNAIDIIRPTELFCNEAWCNKARDERLKLGLTNWHKESMEAFKLIEKEDFQKAFGLDKDEALKQFQSDDYRRYMAAKLGMM